MNFTKGGTVISASYQKIKNFLATFEDNEHIQFSTLRYHAKYNAFYSTYSINIQMHLIEAEPLFEKLYATPKDVGIIPRVKVKQYTMSKRLDKRKLGKKHYLNVFK